MQVHRYEETPEAVNAISKPSIFLAGPTVRGNQPHLTSWRFEAIEEFKRQGFDGDLIVPEFTSKTESDKGKEWIPLWEYNGLKKSDCILFWIPRTKELIALTTNMEFGYWQGREPEKMVYGRPDDAYRMGYLDVMWKAVSQENDKYEPSIYHTMQETITASITLATKRFNKKDILIGSLFELVLKNRTEEESDLEFMRLAKEWGEKGYNLASGKINEDKVDELWAIKFENNVEDKNI